MDRKSLKSAVRILALRKMKAEAEVARLRNGVVAGNTMRDRLLEADSDCVHADLTTAYIQRTVNILEKGLTVLRQQQGAMVSAVHQADCAAGVVQEKLIQSEQKSERSMTEELISSAKAPRAGAGKRSG